MQFANPWNQYYPAVFFMIVYIFYDTKCLASALFSKSLIWFVLKFFSCSVQSVLWICVLLCIISASSLLSYIASCYGWVSNPRLIRRPSVGVRTPGWGSNPCLRSGTGRVRMGLARLIGLSISSPTRLRNQFIMCFPCSSFWHHPVNYFNRALGPWQVNIATKGSVNLWSVYAQRHAWPAGEVGTLLTGLL